MPPRPAVRLDWESRGTAVPYSGECRGSPSHDYIDLTLEPHRVDELPEAQEWPLLREVMLALNSGSLFFTVSSASWQVPDGPADQPHRHRAYLEIALRDLSEDDMPMTLYLVFHHYAQLAVVRLPDELGICFWLRPLDFHRIHRRTWGLAINLQACSASLEKAKETTEPGLQLFFELLRAIGPATP